MQLKVDASHEDVYLIRSRAPRCLANYRQVAIISAIHDVLLRPSGTGFIPLRRLRRYVFGIKLFPRIFLVAAGMRLRAARRFGRDPQCHHGHGGWVFLRVRSRRSATPWIIAAHSSGQGAVANYANWRLREQVLGLGWTAAQAVSAGSWLLSAARRKSAMSC
jgi:hypothetical protein